MLLRMSSTRVAGARQRSSSERELVGVEARGVPAPRGRTAPRTRARARSRRRASWTRSISSGGASHAVSKYSGGGGYARASAVVVDRLARPAQRSHRRLFEARRQVAVGEAVEVDRVVPEDLALALVGELRPEPRKCSHRVRVLRVGVREVGLEHDVVVAHPSITWATSGSSHSVEIQQLRWKYSVGDIVQLGRLEPARELEVLLDAVQPRRAASRSPPPCRRRAGAGSARTRRARSSTASPSAPPSGARRCATR